MSKRYNYYPVFYNNHVFYKFTYDKKHAGYIPAGIEIAHKGKQYNTPQVLTIIADLWKNNKFPQKFLKGKNTIHDWLTAKNDVNKREFIIFVSQLSELRL